MKEKAMKIVVDYISQHLDNIGVTIPFEVRIVWMCKALQNWKFLISSTLEDGMYYELTYNGNAHCWYVDVYKKHENKVIPDGEIEEGKVIKIDD